MTEEELANRHIWVPKVRQAVKDRALWLLYLYRAFSEVLPAAEVEARMRSAIRQFGHDKGRRDVAGFGPDEWADNHKSKGSADVFDSGQLREAGRYEQQMRFCPLVELWREEGCAPAEVALLCDIAMEGDRGRAEHHGLSMELAATLAEGAPCCRLIVTETKR
jgi:hypothetical protein